jgi:nucleoid-associated protein YgaU
MKKKYHKIASYQGLLFETIKEKYFDLIVGIFVFTIVFSLLYRSVNKNIRLNLAFRLPNFNLVNKTVKNKVVKKIPVKTYVVSEGDDLWHLGEKFYGSGFNAYDISVANKLDPSSVIEPGQKLIIPVVTPRTITVGDILNGISTNKVTYTEGKYIVQPGDSLSIIAQKVYGDLDAWPRLLQANSLRSADQIEVGMILTIPH